MKRIGAAHVGRGGSDPRDLTIGVQRFSEIDFSRRAAGR